MNGFSTFLQLQKVDVAKREVWGVAALEQADRAREIMDYEKSLPNFINWSRDMNKASGGQSLGNVRAMHRDVAAGKVIHFEPRDTTKQIYIGAKIVDDNEWKKVLEGVYTGFSVGGSYGEKWPDPVLKGVTRYEAKPVEISLVDVPCMPGAMFEVVKSDGASEMRKFVAGEELEKHYGPNDHKNGTPQSVHGGGGSGEDYDPYKDTYKRIKDSGQKDKKTLDSSRLSYRAMARESNKSADELESDDPVYNSEKIKEHREKAKAFSAQEKAIADYQKELTQSDEWNSEVKRGISGVSSLPKSDRQRKVKELSRKKDSWTGMSLDTVREERDRYNQMLYSSFGEENVKRGKYPNEYKSYEQDMNAWENMLIEARWMKAGKSLGVAELLKEANMNTQELLSKLAASTDPAMQTLAGELEKAFPPKKEKKDEESDDPEGDKKSKKNPFDPGDEPQEEDGHEEPDGDEGPNPEAESDGDSDESAEAEEQPTAGQPSTEQTEAIRAVVIQLLEELGFVQEQGGQPGAPAAVKFVTAEALQKRLSASDELKKQYDALAERQKELTSDIVKVANGLDEMAKRGGPAPIIRDLGAINPQNAGELQKAAMLKDVIEKTADPVARQALQAELTRLEIKQVQKNQ